MPPGDRAVRRCRHVPREAAGRAEATRSSPISRWYCKMVSCLISDHHWQEWWEPGFELVQGFSLFDFCNDIISSDHLDYGQPEVARLALGSLDVYHFLPRKNRTRKEAEDLGKLTVLAMAKFQAHVGCKIELCEPMPAFIDGVTFDKEYWVSGKPWDMRESRTKSAWEGLTAELIKGCEANSWRYLQRPSDYYSQKGRGYGVYLKPHLLQPGTPCLAFEHGLHLRKGYGI